MQAVIYEHFGDESVLSLRETAVPQAASAVQIARSLGARITGVCGTANVDYVRSIGAERVIDYRTDD